MHGLLRHVSLQKFCSCWLNDEQQRQAYADGEQAWTEIWFLAKIGWTFLCQKSFWEEEKYFSFIILFWSVCCLNQSNSVIFPESAQKLFLTFQNLQVVWFRYLVEGFFEKTSAIHFSAQGKKCAYLMKTKVYLTQYILWMRVLTVKCES